MSSGKYVRTIGEKSFRHDRYFLSPSLIHGFKRPQNTPPPRCFQQGLLYLSAKHSTTPPSAVPVAASVSGFDFNTRCLTISSTESDRCSSPKVTLIKTNLDPPAPDKSEKP
ncbi:hypothetical protein BaRGS_00030666 [Batillaria attramentaria]|uniref:Uncharacterized protein n=1 Tax=Batillaria attramentaria TaxID=370345 RepID=A0ABD0JSP4_9CAEN